MKKTNANAERKQANQPKNIYSIYIVYT